MYQLLSVDAGSDLIGHSEVVYISRDFVARNADSFIISERGDYSRVHG